MAFLFTNHISLLKYLLMKIVKGMGLERRESFFILSWVFFFFLILNVLKTRSQKDQCAQLFDSLSCY